MADATFEKVSMSDKPLYGPRKLLLCGFSSAAQDKFGSVLTGVGLREVPKIWVTEDQAPMTLSALLQLPDNSGASVSSNLLRAIVVAGISQQELISLMTTCKNAGMMNALWATLTPTSESWTIQQLLTELAAERKALATRK